MTKVLRIMAFAAVAVATSSATGCSCRKAVKSEVATLVKRLEQTTERVEHLEKRVRHLTAAAGEAGETTRGAVATKYKAGIEKPGADLAEKLYGTWKSEEVPTAVGPTVNTVTFRDDGTVTIDTRSTLPFMGHLRTTEGPFCVEGDTLVSSTIEGGTKVKYWFEGDDNLVIQTKDNKLIRLHRS